MQRGDLHTSSSVGLAFPRGHLVLELVVLVVLVVMDVRRLEERKHEKTVSESNLFGNLGDGSTLIS